MACIIHNGSEHTLSIKFNNSHSYQHYKKIFLKILEDNNILDGECPITVETNGCVKK